MTYIVVDVEADGPCPGLYSMVSLGAIALTSRDEAAWPEFYGQTRPLDGASWEPARLEVCATTRDEHEGYRDPADVMSEFAAWVGRYERPVFVSDNNGFDWMFVCWYLWRFTGANPFGFSSVNLSSLNKGTSGDMFASLKPLRRTAHTHHPVDDARGNAEALVAILDRHGIRGSGLRESS